MFTLKKILQHYFLLLNFLFGCCAEGSDCKKKRSNEDLPEWVLVSFMNSTFVQLVIKIIIILKNYLGKKEDKKEVKKESKKKEKALESTSAKSLNTSLNKLLQLSGEAIHQLKSSSSRATSAASSNKIKNDKLNMKPLLPAGTPVSTAISSSLALGMADTTSQAKRHLAPASSGAPKRAKLDDNTSNTRDRVTKALEESLKASVDAAAAQALSTGSLSEANMDILLHAAGLEVKNKTKQNNNNKTTNKILLVISM